MSHQVNSSGECSKCKANTNDIDNLTCYECRTTFHAVCGDATPFGSKTFVNNFRKTKVSNFLFVCDSCLTKWENNEASSMKEQIQDLTATVTMLAQEFKTFKDENKVSKQNENVEERSAWSNSEKVKQMKASLCIKSKGTSVDMEKFQEIANENSIQVSKTIVKDNGDVFVELPSVENRNKLTPFLNDESFSAHEVVELKSKLPTISILDVKEFTTKDEFVEKIKNKNPDIKRLIDNGSTLSIVYSKNPSDNLDGKSNKFYQVVARVSDDVRKAIKANKDKIFVNLQACRVVDRFYIKRCNRCQKFGHYEKDCDGDERCGYCCGSHLSKNCQEVSEHDHDQYKCVNCKDGGKDPGKHSALWHKCPMYLEMQKKLKKTIPYYQKN